MPIKSVEQYQRLESLLPSMSPEVRSKAAAQMASFRQMNPQVGQSFPGLTGMDAVDQSFRELDRIPENVEPEETDEDPIAEQERLGNESTLPPRETQWEDRSLPNASKDIRLNKPPEFIPGGAGFTDTLFADQWEEPTLEQFKAEMGPAVAQEAIRDRADPQLMVEGMSLDSDAYKRYADLKWSQAYDAAAAEGRPIVRAAFKRDESWLDKTRRAMGDVGEKVLTFGYSMADGAYPFLGSGIAAGVEKLSGEEHEGAVEAAKLRNPKTTLAGTIAGALTPVGLANQTAQMVKAAVAPTNFTGRLLASIAGGGLGSGLHEGIQSTGEELVGDDGFDAGRVLSNTAKGVAAGAVGGGAGEILGSGIQAGRDLYRAGSSARAHGLKVMENAGVETDALSGIRLPGKMQEEIQATRGLTPNAFELPAEREVAPAVANRAAAESAAAEEAFRGKLATARVATKDQRVSSAPIVQELGSLIKSRSASDGVPLPFHSNTEFKAALQQAFDVDMVKPGYAVENATVVPLDDAVEMGLVNRELEKAIRQSAGNKPAAPALLGPDGLALSRPSEESIMVALRPKDISAEQVDNIVAQLDDLAGAAKAGNLSNKENAYTRVQAVAHGLRDDFVVEGEKGAYSSIWNERSADIGDRSQRYGHAGLPQGSAKKGKPWDEMSENEQRGLKGRIERYKRGGVFQAGEDELRRLTDEAGVRENLERIAALTHVQDAQEPLKAVVGSSLMPSMYGAGSAIGLRLDALARGLAANPGAIKPELLSFLKMMRKGGFDPNKRRAVGAQLTNAFGLTGGQVGGRAGIVGMEELTDEDIQNLGRLLDSVQQDAVLKETSP